MQPEKNNINELFRTFSSRVSDVIGSVWAFLITFAVIIGTGVFYNFSDEWKNNINLVVTIATFLVLFFLQKSQNIGDKATHLKLDELIRAIEGTREDVMSAEAKPEHEIEKMRKVLAVGTDDKTVGVE